MFDFDEKNEKDSKQQNEQSLNEINYDVDPSLQQADPESGESNENDEQSNNLANAANEQDSEVKENKQDDVEKEEESDDDDDDDEDNMVNVVISDIVNKPYSAQNSTEQTAFLNRQKSHLQLPGQAATATAPATAAAAKVPAKGVDLDAPGMINDLPTDEYDLQEVKDEDKPWRMPGADITDYFNYGFTEDS